MTKIEMLKECYRILKKKGSLNYISEKNYVRGMLQGACSTKPYIESFYNSLKKGEQNND